MKYTLLSKKQQIFITEKYKVRKMQVYLRFKDLLLLDLKVKTEL